MKLAVEIAAIIFLFGFIWALEKFFQLPEWVYYLIG